ncbi:MAG: ABC transporter permease [Microbacteriaceae bacterium]|nr:ABC transporter permease [Microbacteriaceae bacterium]
MTETGRLTTGAPTTTPLAALSVTQTIRLVAQREVLTRLRSKSFLISTGVLMLIVLASIIVGALVSSNAELPKVAVQRSVTNALPKIVGFDLQYIDTLVEAERLVRSGAVEAAVVSNSTVSKLGITVIALREVDPAVVAAVSLAPDVRILTPETTNPFLAYLVALGFGVVFFLSTLTFGSTIAQSVVEEKQTRIVEILLATISARLLLAGKVIGNSLLAFGQVALIATLTSLGLLITGQHAILGDIGPSILWFIVFFVFGFVLLAALFAAAASLVSRQEDVGSVTSPVTTLVMAPYVAVIFFHDNPVVLAVMSYVPFSAPVGMPMRLFLGTAQWWEPLISLVILLASTAAVVGLGARIYSNALLRMGARVKLSEALARPATFRSAAQSPAQAIAHSTARSAARLDK